MSTNPSYVSTHSAVAWGAPWCSGQASRTQVLRKAALTFWSRPRCREVKEKESEGEAEQLQAPGIEGGLQSMMFQG